MDKILCVIVFGALAVANLVQDITAQTVHVVGDNIGWTIPNNGAVAYTNWAAGKTFSVGDTLVFNFGTNQHDVLQVQKTSFDECNSQNAIGDPIMAGPANVTLDSAGDHYYICTFGRHCQNGQKLAITVSSTSTPGANPPTPSKPTTPDIPSPSSSTQPEACAPTPAAAGSSGSTPGGGANPPRSSSAPGGGAPPPSSSSSAVLASFLLGLSSVVLATFL
ncbi:basic blue protein-like [Nicotiana tabacum]|uniref:Basic blue protein-like n=2 Tax=Nicotiana TaxID=4085 RepID=A0A1S3ZP49_TOBAC|nr:PREDICTED: cucumber peeling cupredoxin-like [Nicotiana sylvestris]XP_016466064.1 PREDICTED: cucumber peeling cupredoxin-like [Nicotiana tabacum]